MGSFAGEMKQNNNDFPNQEIIESSAKAKVVVPKLKLDNI